MTLSIVIVSYNAREHLENCLRSLFSAPPSTPFHVVVVDNASSDGSVEAVRRGWPLVQVIAEARNRGFAGGNNVGIRATDGELVLLLNNDTIVGPGAIETLVERLRAHPDAAVATISPGAADYYIFPAKFGAFGLLMAVFLIFEPLGLVGIWRRVRNWFFLWPFRHRPLRAT